MKYKVKITTEEGKEILEFESEEAADMYVFSFNMNSQIQGVEDKEWASAYNYGTEDPKS